MITTALPANQPCLGDRCRVDLFWIQCCHDLMIHGILNPRRRFRPHTSSFNDGPSGDAALEFQAFAAFWCTTRTFVAVDSLGRMMCCKAKLFLQGRVALIGIRIFCNFHCVLNPPRGILGRAKAGCLCATGHRRRPFQFRSPHYRTGSGPEAPVGTMDSDSGRCLSLSLLDHLTPQCRRRSARSSQDFLPS